jgi:hypothetical protein
MAMTQHAEIDHTLEDTIAPHRNLVASASLVTCPERIVVLIIFE